MKNNRKCVIFGAGERGTNIFRKLSIFFDVIAYADNNKDLWGRERNGAAIIPPDDLTELVKKTGAAIFIANELHYLDIAAQLDGYGLSYYNCENYFCYEREDGVWYPVSFGRPEACRKTGKDKFSVLFVQVKPCTRTDKIAQALKSRGVLTYSAYTASASDAGNAAYLSEFPFWTYGELLDFVNESEFDIIHCSNEPDILVNLLLHSNKKVIHDCHDIVTMSKSAFTSTEAAVEFVANTQADGVISTTEAMRELLIRKYGTDYEKTLVLGNYPLSSFKETERLPKRSAADGEIHCVYEGMIVDRTQAENVPYRFYEPLFLRLAELGVHVHIYSSCVPEYLKQLSQANSHIHYEGNYGGQKLITEMSQFDLGLLLFPVNTLYLRLSSPNKMTEYLSAGLPVVTNIPVYASILSQNQCGGFLDIDSSDIISQMQAFQKLYISPNLCDACGFTMDANAERILNFYKKVISQ